MNKYLQDLQRTIMIDTPTNYQESNEYYSDLLSQKIEDMQDFAPDTFVIEQEVTKGTLTFSSVKCRVCHAIEPKTGLNLGDDFRDLKFFDLDTVRKIGDRYRFDSSIWLTTNTDNYKYVTKSAIVRRCNNELRWIDLSTGNLVSEPCIIDYSFKYNSPFWNQYESLPQGRLIVYVQKNSYTNQIEINDRFLLENQSFKVFGIFNSLRGDTYNSESVSVMTINLIIDEISPDDNFNSSSPNFNSDYPEYIANIDKYSGIFVSSTTKNGVYITPIDYTVLLGRTKIYECFLYLNDVKQTNIFTFVFSGLSTDYYSAATIDNNSFSITNKAINLQDKLIVTCTSGTYSEVVEVEMGGVF